MKNNKILLKNKEKRSFWKSEELTWILIWKRKIIINSLYQTIFIVTSVDIIIDLYPTILIVDFSKLEATPDLSLTILGFNRSIWVAGLDSMHLRRLLVCVPCSRRFWFAAPLKVMLLSIKFVHEREFPRLFLRIGFLTTIISLVMVLVWPICYFNRLGSLLLFRWFCLGQAT